MRTLLRGIRNLLAWLLTPGTSAYDQTKRADSPNSDQPGPFNGL